MKTFASIISGCGNDQNPFCFALVNDIAQDWVSASRGCKLASADIDDVRPSFERFGYRSRQIKLRTPDSRSVPGISEDRDKQPRTAWGDAFHRTFVLAEDDAGNVCPMLRGQSITAVGRGKWQVQLL
jgi:hypothetical protein